MVKLEGGQVWQRRTRFVPANATRTFGQYKWRSATKPAVDGHGVDAWGLEIRTVIQVISVAGYGRRVLYTRRFVDPDGRVVGKDNLRITTTSAMGAWRSGKQYKTHGDAAYLAPHEVPDMLEAA